MHRQVLTRYFPRCPQLAHWLLPLLCVVLAGNTSPWIKIEDNTRVYSTAEIPMQALRAQVHRYAGAVFGGRFKFYHIYHGRGRADAARREQVIQGKTHFTARPIDQYLYVVEIQITPDQERWLRDHHIERQDVITARVRFAGIAPGGALAFDLLQVLPP